MKDIFADLVDNTPVCRTVTYNGRSKEFKFRRLTSGERMTMNRSLKYKAVGKGEFTTEAGLADLYIRNMLLLQYSLVDSNGKNVFKNVEEVQELEAGLFDALYKEAEDVNKEEAVEGKY